MRYIVVKVSYKILSWGGGGGVRFPRASPTQ